jgi:hypothetical protein
MAIEDNHHANEAIKAIQILAQRHTNEIKYLREQYNRLDAEHKIAEEILQKKEKIFMAIGFFIGALGVALIFYIMYTWS